MKEGLLLYMTGKEVCRKEQIDRFIDRNGLQGVPVVVTGQAEDTPNFYEAYRMLGTMGVEIVECFSAHIDGRGELELLKSNITLSTGIDLLQFCSPEELGLSGETGPEEK